MVHTSLLLVIIEVLKVVIRQAKGKPAAKPAASKTAAKPAAKAAPKDWKSQHGHLFTKDPRDFRIGRAILPKKRDLSRYVKWPRYVRIQRQRAILKQRLKVPPALNQFTKTLDKNQGRTSPHILSAVP